MTKKKLYFKIMINRLRLERTRYISEKNSTFKIIIIVYVQKEGRRYTKENDSTFKIII